MSFGLGLRTGTAWIGLKKKKIGGMLPRSRGRMCRCPVFRSRCDPGKRMITQEKGNTGKQKTLRRRLRLPLPLTRARCGGEGAPGCRALVDNLGDLRPGVPAHWPVGAPRLRARKSLDPGCPGGDRARRQSCATAVAGQHHGTRGRSRRSTTARFRHLWCCRTRRSPVLRCNTCVTYPTRWQPASWHVTPNSLAVAPIACVFLPLRSGGAGTTNPSAWCSASLHCVRAVPLPRCAPRPHRDGQGAGGVPWRLRSSERHAALSSESGQCLRCPQPKTTCR